MTLLSAEADLQDDGFTERFKFDSTPPRNAVLRRTPSLEDSDYSSSAATVNANVIDDEEDATSPPPSSACIDTAPSSSALPNDNDNPAASTTPHEDEYMLYVFKPFLSLLTKGGEAYEFDSLQAGSYGRLIYILPSGYNSCS